MPAHHSASLGCRRVAMPADDMETVPEEEADKTKNLPWLELKVAVAVCKNDSSAQALKWALEKMLSTGGTLYLLHVQPRLRFIHTPLGLLPLEQANEESQKQARQQHCAAPEKFLQKYRNLCQKKKVEPQVVCMESDSVPAALLEQIKVLGISKLVLGSSSTRGLKKFFKHSRMSALVAQDAPDFCAVMVVRKGRLSSVKDATHLMFSGSSDGSQSGRSDCNVSTCSTNEETFSQFGSSIPSMHSSSWSFSSKSSSLVLHSGGSHHSLLQQKENILQACTPKDNHHVSVPPISQYQILTKDPLTTSRLNQYGPSMNEASQSTSTTKATEGNLGSKQNFGQHGFLKVDPCRLDTFTKALADNCHSRCLSSQGGDAIKLQRDHKGLSSNLALQNGLFPFTNGEMQEYEPHSANFFLEAGEKSSDKLIQGDARSGSTICLQKKINGVIESEANPCIDARDLEVGRGNPRRALSNGQEEPSQLSLEAALQVALKDKDEVAWVAAEELKRKLEAVKELMNVKLEAEALRLLANSAREEATAAIIKYQETLTTLENMRSDLARESERRKHAEERALKEATAKQEIIILLHKAYRKYAEYSLKELQAATDDFAESHKLGEGGYGKVYKGQLWHMDVAVKVLQQAGRSGYQQFRHEVELLSSISHPHIVGLLGSCQERACLIYEYMSNGSLEDWLNQRGGIPPLSWYSRVRILFEVTTALVFLHNMSPAPIIHRDLKPGNILLDHNFVTKLSDVGLARWVSNDNLTCTRNVYNETTPAGTFAYMDPEYLRTGTFGPSSDVFALGIMILQMLTGKQAVGVAAIVETAIDGNTLSEVLDMSAGNWPPCDTLELAKLGVKCAEPRRRDRPSLQTDVLVLLSNFSKNAQVASIADAISTPSFFICPLSQETMLDPCVAADGFTYEYSAIKDWLSYRDTSPMTNLKLDHKRLVRDLSLQSTILEWKGRFDAG